MGLFTHIRQYRIDRISGHTFLKNHLHPTGLVIDLGMNKGDFGRAVHDRYGCSVVGLEANPLLAATTSQLNGIVCKNVAISEFDGFLIETAWAILDISPRS